MSPTPPRRTRADLWLDARCEAIHCTDGHTLRKCGAAADFLVSPGQAFICTRCYRACETPPRIVERRTDDSND